MESSPAQTERQQEAPDTSGLIICGGRGKLHRRIMHCPTCDKMRRFACSWEMWYGTTTTCCHCGDSWSDGEPHPRPFRRGWRKESIARARRDWANALSAREFRKVLRAELDTLVCSD